MTAGAGIISHAELGTVYLRDFLPGEQVTEVDDWEYMDEVWAGEISGFTQFMRLRHNPRFVRLVCLYMEELPASVAREMFRRLGIPLRPGMTIQEIEAVLGAPHARRRHLADRFTYEFFVTSPDPYWLRCTVLHDGGLIYFTLETPAPDEAEDAFEAIRSYLSGPLFAPMFDDHPRPSTLRSGEPWP